MVKSIRRGVMASVVMLVFLLCPVDTNAQVAIKNNLLHTATLTPNLGIEVGLSRKSTAQIHYGINAWNMKDNRKWKHWVVMPEYRYWLCNTFNGHFFGVHALGGQFQVANINVPSPGAFIKGDNLIKEAKDRRLEGSYAGAGVTYGYQWILNRHLNIEAELGAGYAHIWYDKYNCGTCGTKLKTGDSDYLGITKLGLSLLYVF